MSNSKANDNYVLNFKEWLNEQNIRMAEIENTIETADKIKASNKKQLELTKERVNMAIEEHNKWAIENNYSKIDLIK